jgi:hypothetical protein
MKRWWVGAALVAGLCVFAVDSLQADVRTDQKTRFQFAGALGKVVNIFGGRTAREGVTSMVAVKGNRKITLNDSTGQIIDLSEQKVYDLDVKKKSYRVTTFAELRRQIEEARKKAEEDARKEQAKETKEPKEKAPERDPNAKEYEVDFDVKNTGEKKAINGFDTHQTVVTVTVREKGKTLEQNGGMVMTSDMWLTPRNPALKEIQDFDLKYAQAVYGSMVAGASPQDMASAMAMYPQMKPALDRMAREGNKIDGTPVLTTITMDGVKSAEQMAQEAKSGGDSGGSSNPTSVSGAIGGLMRRRQQPKEEAQSGPKNRINVLTTSVEVLKLTTDVPADVVAVPAGYKESK